MRKLFRKNYLKKICIIVSLVFEHDSKKKLTYATVAIVTEHEPLIAITFVHFIVNVVAILSTGVPIFAPT